MNIEKHMENTNKSEPLSLKDMKDFLIIVLIAIISAMIFTNFFRIATVDGDSMNQTLHDGQKLILSTKAYSYKDMERGDIIVAEKNTMEEHIIKRLIGLPGDHIVIKNNELYVNDKKQKESYINEPMITPDLDITVPDGKIFVMGDNRNHSTDSRFEMVGFIDIQTELTGKIIFKK